jgi:hypothetical protein
MKQYSDIELLAELIKRNNIHEAPSSTIRYGKHYESLIAIGDNHTAFLTIIDDAYEHLIKEYQKNTIERGEQ